MIKRFVYCLAGVICLLGISTQYAYSAKFVNDVIDLHEKLADGTPVNIKITKVPIPKNYPYLETFMWGGDELEMPRSVISKVIVNIGKKRVYIPLSAYSDLGDPRKIKFLKTKDGFMLIISGSDAGGSYKATLRFDRHYIKTREVVSSEFPGQVWEETKYSFISPDSDM
jgi:hypothetical protein